MMFPEYLLNENLAEIDEVLLVKLITSSSGIDGVHGNRVRGQMTSHDG
jgi:hypothetical protein